MNLRKEHILKFLELSPAERLQWALQTGRANFSILSSETQSKILKIKADYKLSMK